ncbi:hypothetical protein LTR53_015565 [Teratosphaeriaceae sp. CCFEE 6253]|nr:hypothetical protein LTR53_015565 [Teratosphaeriaceae sp. CCFEE 6253]
MALHHRQHVHDMRFAYGSSTLSRHSGDSESEQSYHSGSAKSSQTQPTDYSSTSPTKRAPHIHYNSYNDKPVEVCRPFFDDRQPEASPRASVETYASTVQSEEDVVEEEAPEYDPPEYTVSPQDADTLAATPADFSALFPSRRRLLIHHDDSTLDGNMNLRIDTEVYSGGRRCDLTLFHLRMHDLKNREFSLRRYCRDSGREVCHSAFKPQKPAAAPKRPGFQRSLSNALSSMRPKSESRAPTMDSLKRNDSGYGSLHSTDLDEHERPRTAGHGAVPQQQQQQQQQAASTTMKLEFSNYAQVDVKRNGGKGGKRYDFEYWGTAFAWKRIVRKDRGDKEVSYHLTKTGTEHVLAYIVPLALSASRGEEESGKGGWVPPCSMWIADESIVRGSKDAADVVIASGLMALTDDAIRRRFHAKPSKQPFMPLPNLNHMGLEYVGPSRLMAGMFRRDTDPSPQSRPSSSRGPPPATSAASRFPASSSRQASSERRS